MAVLFPPLVEARLASLCVFPVFYKNRPRDLPVVTRDPPYAESVCSWQ